MLWACARPPAGSDAPTGPTRLPILDPDYGRAEALPDAVALGAAVDRLALALADGGRFELDAALAAGPVVLIWIGGAEHEAVSAWVRDLAAALPELDQRATTLVLVRSLPPESALRWATDLHLQAAVASDVDGALAGLLGAPPEGPSDLDFAVLIVVDGLVAYRKLGGRRPELDELLTVLDGEAERLRCCPGACVGDPCE